MSRALVLRADASRSIGTGHLMRCLALAQAWRDAGGEPLFLCAELPEALERRLRAEAVGARRIDVAPGSADDATRAGQVAAEVDADWLVIDGYRFDHRFYAAARRGAHGIVRIDDLGFTGPAAADLVLNQNIYARAELYPDVDAETELLLGVGFALLRDEFLSRPPGKPATHAGAHRLLISMGGGDPAGATRTAIEALRQLDRDDVEATVVIGAAADATGIEELAGRCRQAVRIVRGVQDMASVLAATDLAICAAGSVSWELCYLGVPSILLSTAPNQEPIAAGVAAAGAARDAGPIEQLAPSALADIVTALLDDDEGRRTMRARGTELVDGRGRERVLRALRAAGRGRVAV